MNWALGGRARLDLRVILSASGERYGLDVRARYRRLLQQAIQDVADDPARAGVAPLADGLWFYHTRHARPRTPPRRIGRPRHLIVFRISGDKVFILRVLHDAMDVPSWLDNV